MVCLINRGHLVELHDEADGVLWFRAVLVTVTWCRSWLLVITGSGSWLLFIAWCRSWLLLVTWSRLLTIRGGGGRRLGI